tara:strand:- start:158 stop:538 length:381 start_codon:yes stop_codon:yes gene_type:complete
MKNILYALSIISLFSPVLQSQEPLSEENDASVCSKDLNSMREWVSWLPRWKVEYPDPKELWNERYGMLSAYISYEHKYFWYYAGWGTVFKDKEDQVGSNTRRLDHPKDGIYRYCMKLREMERNGEL